MKQLKISKFNWLAVAFMVCTLAHAQKQTKKYQETFNVDPEVVIDINTSHADIEFETWDKNQVVVEAYYEIEDATKEEAQEYFERWGFEAMGNSKEVKVKTKSSFNFSFAKDLNVVIPDMDFNFVLPEIPDIEPMLAEIKAMPPLPPMPRIHNFNFDYEAYKKDGDKYLKEWKKDFQKNFDKDFEKEMKEWKERMEAHKAEWSKHREEMKVEREKHREEREKHRAELEKNREKMRAEMDKVRAEAKAAREKARAEGKDENVFWFNTDGDDKNFKVKKTIKIKMPKGAKLKMNVRHGEVKLAENIKNIKATLSHTRLLAQNLEGSETNINASYAPIFVNNWKKGKLQVNFIEDVLLKNVNELDLETNSSEVVIENLKSKGYIIGNLGSVHIQNLDPNFINLDVTINNTETYMLLPKSALSVNYKGKDSTFKYPKLLKMVTNKEGNYTLISGYQNNKNSNKNIVISANYSNVIMEQ